MALAQTPGSWRVGIRYTLDTQVVRLPLLAESYGNRMKPSRLKSLSSTLCVVVLRNILSEERRQMNAKKGHCFCTKMLLQRAYTVKTSKNYTTVILLYIILHILCLPLESDSADEFEERWRNSAIGIFPDLPSIARGVLGMLQTSPSPLPIDFSQGQAQSARVLAWPKHSKYLQNIFKIRLARYDKIWQDPDFTMLKFTLLNVTVSKCLNMSQLAVGCKDSLGSWPETTTSRGGTSCAGFSSAPCKCHNKP